MAIKLLRKSEVLQLYPVSKSTLHNRIHEGLIPPPISLGDRAIAWPAHEIEAVIQYLAAGYAKSEIKDLVLKLINQRSKLTEDLQS